MNYRKLYKNIIKRAKNRKLTCYKENHHIIPRCLGGSDDKNNLVYLTAKEHFMCHRLLCLIYPKNGKLKSAVFFLSCIEGKGQKRYKISARIYARLREEYSIYRSLNSSGVKNNNYGKRWSEEKRALASIRQKENCKKNIGENNPSKRPESRRKISLSKLGEKNPRFQKWEIVDPSGVSSIIPGGYQLVDYLKNLGFTKPMFHKKVGDYKVQKDGWKLRSLFS